jgi:NADH-quinone oxidoreductase subunit L
VASTATKWTLSMVTTAIALGGLGLGLSTWRTAEHPSLEPAFLRRAWYIDGGVAALVAGPVRAVAAVLAFFVDRKLVDGFVNAVGSLLGMGGRGLRRAQNGYLRSYLLGLSVGLIIILGYVAFRVGS